jgi:glutamyl-tRNA synthetase
MRNFLALLGWSPGEDREILPEEELVQLFTLEGIQKKPAVFDTTKLEWMNGQYLSLLPVEMLVDPVLRQLRLIGLAADRDITPVIESVKARSRTILHVAEQVAVRLDPSRAKLDSKGEALIRKMGASFVENLMLAVKTLESLPPTDWESEHLLATLKAVAETHGLKLGDLMQPVRVALTGSTVSEPVNELLTVIGRERSIDALTRAAQRLQGATHPA